MAYSTPYPYEKNEIRATAGDLIFGAAIYSYIVSEVISGKNIFTLEQTNFYFVSFLTILWFVLSASLLGNSLYKRGYNRRLAETGAAFDKSYFSERTWNYMNSIVLIIISICLGVMPYLEIGKGLATGGLLFQNYRLADSADIFWQMIYFHFAICAVPFFIGVWCLLFPPHRVAAKI